MIYLFAAINRFRDSHGSGVKTEWALGTGPGGGDGMDFATGAEIFQWSSESVPSGAKPRRLASLRVDTSAWGAAANSLVIIINGRTYTFPGGNVGYLVVTANAPFTMIVKGLTQNIAGQVGLAAYDYNALFTGAVVAPALTPQGSAGNSGQVSGKPAGAVHPFGVGPL
jgi:hypothetical protein